MLLHIQFIYCTLNTDFSFFRYIMNTNLKYPESPKNIPSNLTRLPGTYILKSIFAIFAIITFFTLYVALVIGVGYLAYYALIYPMDSINKLTIILKVGAIGGSIMLLAFTVKFIFKIKNFKPTNRIKLNKDEHVDLWNFIYQICAETGAPKPKNIYVDPDVNAYVAYSNTWLSLFLPIKKELTIGMGLTDTLNLSEFKAVISHEFGHFAQRSMKIGSYINSANSIIHDMIFNRDKWDDILEQWRHADIRLSAAAWLVTPVIWVIRQVLTLFYQFLNIMYSSLSREMEFNADKVAVRTSGSEAIVAALWKLDTGFENWNTTVQHAYLASKKKVFTKNLYKHNQIAHERIKDVQSEALNTLPKDVNGIKQYFSSSENSKVGMYSSHPPNDLRENNAKTPFISCKSDTRNPWILFNNHEKLQEEMTSLIYNEYIGQKVEGFSEMEVFENFILQETQGKELQEEYQNTFENRFLHIEDSQELMNTATLKKDITKSSFKELKEHLKTLMEPIREIELLMQKAVEISNKTTTETKIEFKGKSFTKKNISEGYNMLQLEREKLFNDTFKPWDIEFCAIHLKLANQINKKQELLDIYHQHKIITEIYKAIINTKSNIYTEFEQLQQQGNIEENTVRNFSSKVKSWISDLNKEITKIDAIKFIPMSNIDDSEEFKTNIIDGGQFKNRGGNIFETGAFNEILNELESAGSHCQRLEQKNIGLILMFHKQLVDTLNED